MADTLKIVIPMAGWGTRMRPHTWSKPKPLVGVAGRTTLDYLLDMFKSVPDPEKTEFEFILGPNLGESLIPPFMAENHPELKVHYVVQGEMSGQSHAVQLTRQYLNGPMIICFSDTLIETDFSFLNSEKNDGVAWVKAVPDPRRFGVAEINADSLVTRLIEKPHSVENNLALVGCYFFKRSEDLLRAIEEQIQRDVRLKNEYYLVDAIDIMLERKASIRVEAVKTWLDTGTIQATLETNRYLLERSQLKTSKHPGATIRPPVFIHETTVIENSTIGPYASIGPNCRISGSRIEDSIIEADCEIRDAALTGSMVGRQARIQGKEGKGVTTLNIGDDSSIVVA